MAKPRTPEQGDTLPLAEGQANPTTEPDPEVVHSSECTVTGMHGVPDECELAPDPDKPTPVAFSRLRERVPMLADLERPLVRGIVSVMQDLNTLHHDSKNQHGNYTYASIDAYMAAVRPAMAKAGLIVVQNLVEQVLESGFLRSDWEFFLIHEAGGVLGPICFRSVAASNMGPQAYGAAQAYALKFLLRSVFLIAADEDEDIDRQKKAPLPKDDTSRPRVSQQPQQPAGRIPQRTRGEAGAAPKADDPKAFVTPLDKLKARIRSIPGASLQRCAAYFGLSSVDEFTEKQIIEANEVLDNFEAKLKAAADDDAAAPREPGAEG